MKIIYDDILNCDENILVHQVNYQGVMGAGLALQIKNRFPGVFYKYQEVCNHLSWQQIQDAGAVDFVQYDYLDGEPFYVANLFGQKYYGKSHKNPDYVAIATGLNTIRRFAVMCELSVAIPYGLGCGLGKGDWSIVSEMISDIFLDYVEYNIYKIRSAFD